MSGSKGRGSTAPAKGRGAARLVAMLVAALVAVGCAGDDEAATTGAGSSGASDGSTGVTADTIKISVSAPFSGPASIAFDKQFSTGVGTWQAETNANGGIGGRQIELVKVDNQYTAEGAVAACKEVKSNGTFMVLILATASDAEASCYEDAGIPAFDNIPTSMDPDATHLLGFTYYPALAPVEVSFLKSDYMDAGDKKVGIVVNGDITQLTAAADAVKDELDEQGMEVVDTETIRMGQASFVAEMTRMEDAGAEVILQYVALEGAGLVRDARSIGYDPQWYVSPGSSSDIAAQTAKEHFDGIRGIRVITTTETPAYQEFLDFVTEHQGEDAAASADTLDAVSFAQGEIIGGLLATVDDELTRDSFLESAKQIEGFEGIGLVGPFTLKGQDLLTGERSMIPVECCNPDFTFKTLGPAKEEF